MSRCVNRHYVNTICKETRLFREHVSSRVTQNLTELIKTISRGKLRYYDRAELSESLCANGSNVEYHTGDHRFPLLLLKLEYDENIHIISSRISLELSAVTN